MNTKPDKGRQKSKNKRNKDDFNTFNAVEDIDDLNIDNIDNLEDIPKKLRKGDKVSRALSLPEGTFRNFPTIEIRGNREVMIDGCTGLLSYATENILLETRYCRIKIIGRSLTLNNFTRNVLAVRGFIQNVEFTM